MANIIKPKRSNTAAKVPTTTELISGELGVNMADRKVYINNGTAVVQVGAGNLSGLGDVAIASPSNGQSLKYNSTTTKWENSTAGAGDVVGPASSTDNALVRFDGTTGKLVQNSTATLNDTGNMDTASVKADYFDLDTAAAAPASAVGREAWDDGAGAPIVGLKGGNVTYYYGQQEFARVYNGSGAAMTKGQVVYIVGAQGNRIDVRLAQANAESTSANTIGLVAEPIAAGAEGWVQTTGPLPKMVTTGLTAGATIYLSPTTAGAYTTTKPSAPNHLVILGFVERVDATVGSIYLKVDNGYELDELHNVNTTSPTGGQLLAYDQTAGYWKNITITDGTGISVTETASGAITVTNTAPDQTVVLTQGGATTITGTYPNFTISSVNTTYGAATSTVPGLIELGSDTAQTVAANAVSATASRSYALQVNAAGQGVVNVPWTDTNSGGTVTSVAVSGGTTGLTTSGGPVTTSGTITLAGTLAVANGGTGATTAATARTNLGATTLGGNLYTLANVAAIAFPRFNADNTISSLDAASFRTAIGAGTSSTTGTVTSVGGTGTVSGLTLSGTVTTSGNLTLGGTLAVTPSNFASQTANTFLAAPNGAAGVPTFRAMVAADVPTLNQNTTGTAANVTGTVAIANGGTGQTTRQNAMDALAGAVTSGQYLRGNGTDVVMSAIQAADVPTLNQSTTGSAATLTTARTINGTSFNGSANITTASWGTARTLWGQSVDGSANIIAPLLPAAGSVTAPAYSTSGDTNTGMYFPFADEVALVAGGVERLKVINGSGSVRIGQTEITPAGSVEIGINGSGDRSALIDFHSSGLPGAIDYSARIIRQSGVNGNYEIQNTGTGSIILAPPGGNPALYVTAGAGMQYNGAVKFGGGGSPEGQLDFNAESDVRWLARGGRLDCVNNANTAWQSGTFRGANLYLRTADDTTRFAVYNDGRAYLQGNSASRGGNGYILSVRNDSLAEPLRAAGYIEWFSNVGAIGVNYFLSDERLKKNIEPTATTARQSIDQIQFKQFDWNEFTDQENEHVNLGVIAQQLQQVNPKFVNEMTDSTLGVNEPELLTYALKAIQEISAELAAVKQQLAQMRGVA